MVAGDRKLCFILFGLAVLLVVPSEALERTRRILNEPGDVPKSGKNSLPFLKRQQIIYLLNNNTNQHAVPKQMESYAKELTPDGEVMKPHATKFYSSEDFHGGGDQEVSVNKGDGPPSLNKQTEHESKKDPVVNTIENNKLIHHADSTIPTSSINKSSVGIISPKNNSSDTLNKQTVQHVDVNASKKSEYPSSDDGKRTNTRSKLFRYEDGELVLPAAPKQIDPNLYEIGQSEINDSPRRFRHLRFREDGGAYMDEPAVRRWRERGRSRRRYYTRRQRRPFIVDRRPNVMFSPMYGGNPPIVSYQSGQGIMQPAYRNQVMMQPLSLPLMSSPQQPSLQSPIIQQADTRSVLYNVPLQSGQLPQPIVYPIIAVPTLPQPQQFVQVQPGMQPVSRPRVSHWSDEQGHARSEEPPRPPPDYYDDDRGYDDRFMYRNERPVYGEREDDDDDEEDDYPRRRPYMEMEENPDARSEPFLPPAVRPTDDENEEGDDDDEVDAYQQDLQDAKDEAMPDSGPRAIEQDEVPSARNLASYRTRNGRRPIFDISSSRIRDSPRFMYPNTMSTDTFTREQLLRSPLAQGALPRFGSSLYQRTNLRSPSTEMSEMSADEARFKERMRLELQAKDTIPKGSKTSNNELKNVYIRLNGHLLEKASDLRSRIVHGRFIPGRGKTIRSKGPMKIRVSHRGKGKHRIKIIDIFTQRKFNVIDSRSKITKNPTIVKKTLIKHNANKPNQIKTILYRHLSKKKNKQNNKSDILVNQTKTKSLNQKPKFT